MLCDLCYFFFHAEDGIRDGHVTGVQTCALPILFLLAAILLSLLDAWYVMDFQEWIQEGQGLVVLQTVLRIVLVCAVAALAWLVLASFIEHRLAVSGAHMPSERERTLLMLFKNALVIIISGLTVLFALSHFAMQIAPLTGRFGVK